MHQGCGAAWLVHAALALPNLPGLSVLHHSPPPRLRVSAGPALVFPPRSIHVCLGTARPINSGCPPGMPQVGRPRPHFVQRCWPNGLRPVFSPDGTPLCADGAVDVFEGIKSFPSGGTSLPSAGQGTRCPGGCARPAARGFSARLLHEPHPRRCQEGRRTLLRLSCPALGAAAATPDTPAGTPAGPMPRPMLLPLLSGAPSVLRPCGGPAGHTSWSTSGLGFLTLWLLGKLRVFADGSPAPERFALAVTPLLGATWIGMSRIQVRGAPCWGLGAVWAGGGSGLRLTCVG